MPVVFSVLFIIRLNIVRHEAKERLEESMLQTICLKKADFTWEKKGKEIRIGKRFFDIKSIKKEKGLYIITGIYDEQEDLLHGQLLNSQKNQDNTSQNKLCNFFFHFYYSTPFAEDKPAVFVQSKILYIDYFSLLLPTPFCESVSPPPDLI